MDFHFCTCELLLQEIHIFYQFFSLYSINFIKTCILNFSCRETFRRKLCSGDISVGGYCFFSSSFSSSLLPHPSPFSPPLSPIPIHPPLFWRKKSQVSCFSEEFMDLAGTLLSIIWCSLAVASAGSVHNRRQGGGCPRTVLCAVVLVMPNNTWGFEWCREVTVQLIPPLKKCACWEQDNYLREGESFFYSVI